MCSLVFCTFHQIGSIRPIKVIKLRRMRWVQYMAHMGETRDDVRLSVLAATSVNTTVFWDVVTCSVAEDLADCGCSKLL
jgi:hypothetical protein